MEFRIEAAARRLVIAALCLAPGLWAQEFRYQVRHEHLHKGCRGTLTLDAHGVSYREAAAKKPKKHPHAWSWSYQDIQQLELAPNQIRVLTYQDDKWKLGADRGYRFQALAGERLDKSYDFLKDRLDQRFVAELPDAGVTPLWEVPVKHLLRFGGSEGVLIFGADRIVYKSDRKLESRTWRYTDIDVLSSSGPFQLSLTTFERARSHYGSRKEFNFQLKQALDEDRYNGLWRRLNQSKGTIRETL